MGFLLVKSLTAFPFNRILRGPPTYNLKAHPIATAQRALALATASGDAVLHALANFYLGRAYQAQGDYRRAIDCLGQTVASLDGARRHERFGLVLLPAVDSRAWLAAAMPSWARSLRAVPLLTQAMEQTIATEMIVYQAFCRLSLGEAPPGVERAARNERNTS
jgi:tetratricopeptide (TPR) repeat protein